ncbi:MAG TPA: hypothetical protein VG518_04610, partial [Solirubrobacterales bacterium]|nr:hypothetical protein [Solirubrobacterales bacterium]
YALRLYQRTMHNRRPESIPSREIGWRDAAVLAPLVLCILGLALYPQLILKRTDDSVQQTVSSATGGPAPEARLATSRRLEAEGWTGYAPIARTGQGGAP